MFTRIALAGLLTAGLVAVAEPAQAAANQPSSSFVAVMSGDNELPAGTGDPDARGVALLQIKSKSVCYVLHVRNVDGTVDGAHIHLGRPDQEGPVVVDLNPPTHMGSSVGCTWIGRKLAWKLRTNPRHYYVNVHSTAYPDGALRGQVHKV